MQLDAAPEAAHTDARSVLVVEDSDDDFDTVVVAAARANVRNRIVRARDAESGWRRLNHDPADSFAFLLLDYHLTGFDGLSLLDRMRAAGWLTRLPVVVLTTSVNPRDRELLCQAGASAFHEKCVQYTDSLISLESIFNQWLGRKAPPREPAMAPPRRPDA